jgi:gamma-glutamyl:cysteine ligase YbdK (ATP-grasp superfamily)
VTDPAGKPTILVAEDDRPGLFEGVGVEIEYMIVDSGSLDVRPVCDELIAAVAGSPVSELEMDGIAWSNELTLHVLELKTNGPAPALRGLSSLFRENVARANLELAALGCRLMPGAVHPWMDPATETHLWPHEYNEVYRTFDRIFGCSGHGWSNLQSTHINLPFRTDDEFARLHAAIRVVLPLIPGLSAASPYLDGRLGPALDSRMVAYRGNARRVPSVSGHIIPEESDSRAHYEREILGRIYADLAPHDPEGVLRHEWANARGAIARFDRGAIEIRVIDAQENPGADLAVAGAVIHLVRALTVGRLAQRDLGADPRTEALAAVLDDAITRGEKAVVRDPALLRVLGAGTGPVPLGRLWRQVVDADPPDDMDDDALGALEIILREGTLGRRMLEAAGSAPGPEDLRRVGKELCGCLSGNRPFPGAG